MRLEEKLVCLRKERHMTQLELAEKLDVSRQAISKWEVGSTVPSTENLIRLAQLYIHGCTAYRLTVWSTTHWTCPPRRIPQARNRTPKSKLQRLG